MSYTVETTYIKPEGAKWFGEVHPGLAKRYNRTDRARAVGLVNRTVSKPNANTVVIISTWNSEADYQSFLAKRGSSVADAMRRQHAQNSGITLSTRVV